MIMSMAAELGSPDVIKGESIKILSVQPHLNDTPVDTSIPLTVKSTKEGFTFYICDKGAIVWQGDYKALQALGWLGAVGG